MKIYIGNMVSNRCKMIVREELKRLKLHFIFVNLGEIEVMENLSPEKTELLKMELHKSGLELLDDKNAIIVESIKNTLIDLIYHKHSPLKIDYSEYLSEKFNLDYTYLSNLFEIAHGIKIEESILWYQIDFIKELIIYDQLSIIEIAQKLNHTNVAQLYLQFEKATGISIYIYKQLKIKRRNVIEDFKKLKHNISF